MLAWILQMQHTLHLRELIQLQDQRVWRRRQWMGCYKLLGSSVNGGSYARSRNDKIGEFHIFGNGIERKH